MATEVPATTPFATFQARYGGPCVAGCGHPVLPGQWVRRARGGVEHEGCPVQPAHEPTTAGPNEWARESHGIVQAGRCRCTDDAACWEHEALEMRAEHARQGAAPPQPGDVFTVPEPPPGTVLRVHWPVGSEAEYSDAENQGADGWVWLGGACLRVAWPALAATAIFNHVTVIRWGAA